MKETFSMKEEPQQDEKIEELYKEKNKIYTEEESAQDKRRENILVPYQDVENAFNNFADKKIDGKELTKILGTTIFGLTSEGQKAHLSAQVYAFELLVKSLSEAESQKDIKKITNEIIFDMATGADDVRKENFWGILAYYAGKFNMNETNSEPSEGKDVALGEKFKIAKNLRKYIDGKNPELKNIIEAFPSAEEIIKIIKKDFSANTPEGEKARLVSKYFEMARDRDFSKSQEYQKKKEEYTQNELKKGRELEDIEDSIKKIEAFMKSPTRLPGVEEEIVFFRNKEEEEEGEEKGKKERIPSEEFHFYKILPVDYIPSEEKLLEELEQDKFNLFPLMEKDYIHEGESQIERRKMHLTEEEIINHLIKMRSLKDEKDYKGMEEERKRIIRETWKKLDDGVKESFGWSQEGIRLRYMTRQNKPGEEIEKNETESPK